MKSYLKWPGGKARLAKRVESLLGGGTRLVEPFVGSGAVFLNLPFASALLGDADPDVIGLHRAVQQDAEAVLAEARALFTPACNDKEAYRRLRAEFNAGGQSPAERAALMLYLNRHCFNGLWRRSGSGAFNVAFGRPASPEIPEESLRAFAAKAAGADIRHQGFEATFAALRQGDAVYCDPPYSPLSATSRFTGYSSPFGPAEHDRLVALCADAAARGIRVVLSEHDLPAVRERCLAAWPAVRFETEQVRRSISCNGGNRFLAPELFAVFEPISLAAAA
ncbi:hypothetical protein WV31_10440 [Magnetospirillum sp. ME-1]|uniref:DNA adenine methylase n=1 Tax=Magnetospirillum sp. ME-1 TaxID=1639348 RepID=UPI000A17DDDE|nr:Dam family site-specific DNA-(adenine-N6)-methyltransferase [Magnetospirillum sp. ME-1]ARJ66045.1 hypothetical protein WV31_10440 [Magnetospirillum sp. ME-1]